MYVCKHCGESFANLLLFGLMADSGARLSWDVRKCSTGEHVGEDHEFVVQHATATDAPAKGWLDAARATCAICKGEGDVRAN